MRILVTGADGFVGRGLVTRLVKHYPLARIVATDRGFEHPATSSRTEQRIANLGDRQAIEQLCAAPFDLVYHLASIPGSAAERLDDAGRAINRDAALNLIDCVARASRGPARFIFASSIAVYGALPATDVSEDILPRPGLSYGAHKLMVEVELADRSRCGELIGASLRLPGIVARPMQESGHGSAFMSQIFHAAAGARAYVCPTSPEARCWWMSLSRVIDNLLHAASLDAATLSGRSAWQLPVLVAEVGDIVAGLSRRHGQHAVAGISYQPDPLIERLFGAMPSLATPQAEAAGFRSDGSIDALIRAVTG